jgi:pimeloyl-ACP methyl ester carboxylesterase
MDDKAIESTTANYLKQLAHAAELAGDQRNLLYRVGTSHAENLTSSAAASIGDGFARFCALWPSLVDPAAVRDFVNYQHDAYERMVLFADTMVRSGNAALDREEEGLKPVLSFDYDLVVDGSGLDRPVNYQLVQIRPPVDYPEQREGARPWVIIDPRAGQGSGIGGLKDESQIGIALKDGHPVYFVVFRRDPEDGQTLADICAAEADFLRQVRTRHPASPKPLVTGNCQGGWAAMILAATHPDLMGPVVIAGAPLSYWAGEVGRNPFRYLAGVMGGSLPAVLASDLGGGTFDGASLVHNFEMLNPGRTYWRKHYDLFANADATDRYMDFDRWWSGFYFMTEAEIRWIVENLFVGNRLSHGLAVLDDGTPVDLNRINSPVVVFASHGDNITSPQQALNWIPDLYKTAEDLRARGHVIVYTLHDSVGHLGIFVSAEVASGHHKQITSVVKTIEALAPGLYEMKIDKGESGFRVSFENRTIEDILVLGGDRREEMEFSAVTGFSEWAVKTYELTWRPLVKAWITPEVAEELRTLHPKRLQTALFSRKNPLLSGLREKAEEVRAKRVPVGETNPYRQLETLHADMIENGLNFWRDMRDAWIEFGFHTLYGTPWMRHYADLEPARPPMPDAARLPEVRDVLQRAGQGGYSEAILRMLILLLRASGTLKKEGLEDLDRMLHTRPPFSSMTPERRRHMIHDQTVIVDFAGKEAIGTLPLLLKDEVDRIRAINVVMSLAGPAEAMDAPTIAMFRHLQRTLMTLARDWHDPDLGAAG